MRGKGEVLLTRTRDEGSVERIDGRRAASVLTGGRVCPLRPNSPRPAASHFARAFKESESRRTRPVGARDTAGSSSR